jgi:hypothetical protein
MKLFNNQTEGGTLLRGYNVGTSKYNLELEDAVQDTMLAI